MCAVVSTSEVIPGSDLMTALPENMPHGISLRLFLHGEFVTPYGNRVPLPVASRLRIRGGGLPLDRTNQ